MSTAPDVGARLGQVRARIEAAIARRGPGPAVRLVGVSKRQPLAFIEAAAAAGLEDFGENYAQELRDKQGARPDAAWRWHFLGALQHNKVRLVIGCALVHTVDRERLLPALETHAAALGRVQDVLVQVNVAGEAGKAGIAPDALPGLLDRFAALPHVRCRGLMLIPPAGDPEATRTHFRALRVLGEAQARRARPGVELSELSMGMSADYEVAIEEGATLVRVGTAIFGERPPAGVLEAAAARVLPPRLPMRRSDRLLLRADDRPAIALRWDRDERVDAREGDTVSLALLDAGVLETSKSAKYRRPRGAYCLRGDCGTCLVRIDGLPNRRACLTVVHEGMHVEPQNRLTSGPDPTALIDTMLRGDMDHHHFMVRPRVVNQIMQGVARNLAGLGTLPDRLPDAPARHEIHRPEVLVVGAGPAGAAAYEVIAAAGRQVLWVDRLDRAGLLAQPGVATLEGLLDHTGVFGAYPAEQLWAAVTHVPGQAAVLRSIHPRHVVVATGARDPTLPLPNNDRPGVVSARGLLGKLRRSGARLQVPAIVVGAGEHARGLARALGADLVDPEQVERIQGNPVERLRLRPRGGPDGGESERECRIVALAAPPAPAFELARQAGAAVRWNGAGFAVQRDAEGRCATGPWTVWAAGDACGYHGAAAADDGRRVALALLHEPLASSP